MGINGRIFGAALFGAVGCAAGLPAHAAALSSPDSDALIAGYQIIQFDIQECQALGSPQGGPGLSRYVSSSVLDLSAKICADAYHYQPILQNAAKEKDFSLPQSLPFYLIARYAALIRHPDENLGKHYLEDQVASHRDALAVFQEEAANGKDPQIKAMAAQVIPLVQSNLASLQAALAKE